MRDKPPDALRRPVEAGQRFSLPPETHTAIDAVSAHQEHNKKKHVHQPGIVMVDIPVDLTRSQCRVHICSACRSGILCTNSLKVPNVSGHDFKPALSEAEGCRNGKKSKCALALKPY